MAIFVQVGDDPHDLILVSDEQGPFSGYPSENQSEAFLVCRYSPDGGWWTDELGNVDKYGSPVVFADVADVVKNLHAMDISWPTEGE